MCALSAKGSSLYHKNFLLRHDFGSRTCREGHQQVWLAQRKQKIQARHRCTEAVQAQRNISLLLHSVSSCYKQMGHYSVVSACYSVTQLKYYCANLIFLLDSQYFFQGAQPTLLILFSIHPTYAMLHKHSSKHSWKMCFISYFLISEYFLISAIKYNFLYSLFLVSQKVSLVYKLFTTIHRTKISFDLRFQKFTSKHQAGSIGFLALVRMEDESDGVYIEQQSHGEPKQEVAMHQPASYPNLLKELTSK